ncbi:MAG: DUF4105 domain-containing protein, partial [Gemmatimonadetes bacterium]|nr:DUF4105 domain-containing protein [Gemmatimonadota bacterium]
MISTPAGGASPSRALRKTFLVLALAGIPGTAVAQETGRATTNGGRLLSDAAQVSLVTIVPGDKVYSLFGHNALRVFDPERGIDIAYNYGTFDFGNPLVFAAKFGYGDLNYRLQRQNYRRMVAFYPAEEGRPLIEQILDLDPEQRQEVFRFLEWNAAPENAYYRYDFYYDNCATRIRDVLEDVLDANLLVTDEAPDVTMRQLLDPYLVERSWLHFGMDAGQGLQADAPATARSELFLPDRLADWAAAARVTGPGGERSLVSRTDSIGWPAERPEPGPSPDWPAIVMAIVLAVVVWVTVLDFRQGRPGRLWFDVFMFLVLGVAGLLLGFLSFVSLHAVTRNNVNLLWALPTNLILASALARKVRRRWATGLLWVTAAAAALFVLGWALW